VQHVRELRATTRVVALAVAALIALFFAPPSNAAEWFVKPLADGVRLVQEIETAADAPLVLSALKFDPKSPALTVKAALGRDVVVTQDLTRGRETVSRLVSRKEALAAINADYFDWTGDPLGLAIIDGELVSEPYQDRAVFGLMADGKAVFDSLSSTGTVSVSGQLRTLNGLNRPRGQNQMILYAPIFGESTNTTPTAKSVEAILSCADLPIRVNRDIKATVQSIQQGENTAIPPGNLVLSGSGTSADWIQENLKVGDNLTIRFQLTSACGVDWTKVTQAVGGGPWLVKDRRMNVTAELEKFNKAFSDVRHPRTAVGVTSTGELLLVAVDGRQSISRGATLAEMAAIMQRLGAVQAINMDGGGSTALSVRGAVANSPSGGQERAVASMIVLSGTPSPGDLDFKFADQSIEVISGQPMRPQLMEAATEQPLDVKSAQNIVWGTTGGIGFVSQEGRFIPIKAGQGAIVAMLGDKKAELPVTVKPSAPAKIEAKLEPDVSGATNRSSITVKILDANGNLIPNHGFKLSAVNGQVDAPLYVTDDGGQGVVGVTWEFTKGGVVTITVGEVKREVRQPEPPLAPVVIPQ
jgi:exopolysaccharide biosynthesis protein